MADKNDNVHDMLTGECKQYLCRGWVQCNRFVGCMMTWTRLMLLLGWYVV